MLFTGKRHRHLNTVVVILKKRACSQAILKVELKSVDGPTSVCSSRNKFVIKPSNFSSAK